MDDRLERARTLLEACDLAELWEMRRWLTARITAVEAASTPREVTRARTVSPVRSGQPAPPTGAAVLLHGYADPVHGGANDSYRASAYGRERADGTWEGWLEFTPPAGGAVLQTGRETTQPDRAALAYWASGLEPVFLEGALARAVPRRAVP